MPRRILAVTLLFALLLVSHAVPVRADSTDVQILFDGQPVVFEVPPLIRDDRTFVPIRFVMERLEGASVGWDPDRRMVTVQYGSTVVLLTIDKTTVTVNSRVRELDVAPFIYQDRTMVPLRFLLESFNFGVDWRPDTRTVVLNSPAPSTPTTPAPSTPTTPAPSTPTTPAPSTPTTPAPSTPTTPAPSTPTTPAPSTPTTPAPSTPTTPAPSTPTTPAPSTPTTPAPGSGGTGTNLQQAGDKVVLEAPSQVKVGDQFTVSVRLSDVVDIQGGAMTLKYDPTLVEAVLIISGNTVEGLQVAKRIDPAKGTVNYVTAIPGQDSFTGSGTYFSVTFRAKAAGSTSFAITTSGVDDALLMTSQSVPVTTMFPALTVSIGN